MKKHTLIDVLHDENYHSYTITIGTDMGQFSGTTICSEEDYDRESRYFGFELAEIRAEIKYARAKRDHWGSQAKALLSFWRNMTGTRTYNADAYWVKKIRQAADDALREYESWEKEIQNLKDLYRAKIVAFDLVNKKRNKAGAKHD